MIREKNLLIDSLPQALTIGEREYPIRWDHKTAILYEMMMLDEEIEGAKKPLLALRLFYPEIPRNLEEALAGISWFYRCGKEEEGGVAGRRKQTERIYSFAHDDGYIFSAFLAQYGMDLTKEAGLHWWKFRALFEGLSEENQFVKIMGYRGMDIPEGMGKEQKEFYRKMKAFYRIPLGKNEKEKAGAIEAALMGGGDLTGLL